MAIYHRVSVLTHVYVVKLLPNLAKSRYDRLTLIDVQQNEDPKSKIYQ